MIIDGMFLYDKKPLNVLHGLLHFISIFCHFTSLFRAATENIYESSLFWHANKLCNVFVISAAHDILISSIFLLQCGFLCLPSLCSFYCVKC